jgi:transposase
MDGFLKQRGRKSSESLTVVPILPAVGPQRPEPPAELTPEQAEVWKTTVSAMRPTWFGAETWPLLTELCRHVALSRLLAIEATDPGKDLKRFSRLASMHLRESSMVAMLSTRLRLTPRSRVDPRTDGRDPTAGLRKPWEPA